MPAPRPWLLVSLVALGLAAGGCGGASHAAQRSGAQGSTGRGATGAVPLTLPTPPPTGIPATRSALAVIRGWSDALRRGDVRGAARYFALPSVMINGPDASGRAAVVDIGTEGQALAANVGLPCGATLAGADQRGPYVNALFSLGSRPGPGGDCRGQRGTARVNFIIRAGRIEHWLRAPDDPGDRALGPGGPPPSSSQPPAGSSAAGPI